MLLLHGFVAKQASLPGFVPKQMCFLEISLGVNNILREMSERWRNRSSLSLTDTDLTTIYGPKHFCETLEAS